jgi:hypothetical protein
MSDSSPVFRRRPRPAVVPETPNSHPSHSSRASGSKSAVKKKEKKKCVRKQRSRKSRTLRQDRLNCKFLAHQAQEKGNSDDNANSEDDGSGTDDSVVASGDDHPDGSYEIYALGMSSQAEAAGFTVPLHKVRYAELNRPNLADSVLESHKYNKTELLKSLPPLHPKDAAALLNFDVLSTNPQPEAPISEMVGLTRATGRLRLSKVFETVMTNLEKLPDPCESLVKASPQASPQLHSCDASVQSSAPMHVDAETQTELVTLVTLADLRTEMRALLVGLGF